MANYYVKTKFPVLLIQEYMVVANSEEEAMQKALEGKIEAETFIGHEWMGNSVEKIIAVEKEILLTNLTNNLKMTNTHNGTFRICREVTISYRDFISTILYDGIQRFLTYGFYIDWDKSQYRDAKDRLVANKLDRTLESIYAEMILSGDGIKFVLKEGFDVQITDLTLDVVEKALWKFLEEEPSDAFQLAFDRVYHNDYDADDCDVLLQYILFGEYMFS